MSTRLIQCRNAIGIFLAYLAFAAFLSVPAYIFLRPLFSDAKWSLGHRPDINWRAP